VETPLTGVVALGRYADPTLRAAVTHLKFKGIQELAEPLGELLGRRLVAAGLHRAPTMPILVPIPLAKARERERGFNQAWLLAEVIGKHLGIPVEHPLVRTKATSPQTSILKSPHARRRNVAGAFAHADTPLRPPHSAQALRGRPGYAEHAAGQAVDLLKHATRVILVDDVLTTGATLTEAARVLAAEGSLEIWGAVVARG
jgi:predicted amidophosphoribosyltransferase